MMRKLLLIGVAALALAGCNPNPDVATPNQAVIAINAYNAGVATGKNYLSLPLCPASVTIATAACRTQTLSQQVYSALKAGRLARAQILAALGANAALPISAIQALEAAYAVIQQIPAK